MLLRDDYLDYYLLKKVTNPAETTGDFAGLDRRICLDPNSQKKVYGLSFNGLYGFWKKGIGFFKNG